VQGAAAPLHVPDAALTRGRSAAGLRTCVEYYRPLQ
jgi:hypothetical protein